MSFVSRKLASKTNLYQILTSRTTALFMLIQLLMLVEQQYICISDNLKYKVCEKQYQLCNSEAYWVNVIDQSDISFVIGVIYRPPSQMLINAFIEDLSNCLKDYDKHSINYFIMKNFNINTSPINRSPDAMHFINTLISCGAFPIITKPTRGTDTTTTIIDHIIQCF